GEPITARPVGPVEKAWRWTKRHPAAVGLLAATAITSFALVAAGLFVTYSQRLGEGNPIIEKQRGLGQSAYQSEAAARKTADEQRGLALRTREQAAQQALKLANRYLYALRINQAEGRWRDNLPERTSELLDACPPDLRGWEWHYLDHQR